MPRLDLDAIEKRADTATADDLLALIGEVRKLRRWLTYADVLYLYAYREGTQAVVKVWRYCGDSDGLLDWTATCYTNGRIMGSEHFATQDEALDAAERLLAGKGFQKGDVNAATDQRD